MTMRLTAFVASFLLIGTSGAFAQKAVPVPPVPRVMPVAPAQRVDLREFHIDLPELHLDLPEFHVDLPDFDVDLDWNPFDQGPFVIAGVQKDKTVTVDVPQRVVSPFNYTFQGQTQIEAVYSQARQRIDSDQYDRALEPLERVISAKGDRADAAMYWKAYSLMKLARRDEALTTLSQMPKQFPDSRWLRDARALEVEVKQAAGQNVSTDAVDDDTKLLALQGIMRTNPEAAFPAVEKMLAGGGSVKIKERALFVLSQSRNDRALGIIANVARTNTNPDLQQRAIRFLGQSSSPEAVTTLTTVYRADNSVETKKTIISALIPALVTLARGERNAELKTSIVRYLSNSNAPEAQGYMLELLK
jgi:tetratricopeptide (TPR) repeat protein